MALTSVSHSTVGRGASMPSQDPGARMACIYAQSLVANKSIQRYTAKVVVVAADKLFHQIMSCCQSVAMIMFMLMENFKILIRCIHTHSISDPFQTVPKSALHWSFALEVQC
jgi:hypothetical protein